MLPSSAPSNSTRQFDSAKEIERLVADFLAGTWPVEKWTHGAHLVVALWHLRRYPRNVATRLIREGIQRYNRSQGIPTTPTRGYHETLTLFWIWAVAHYLASAPPEASLVQLAHGLLQSPCGDKNYPFLFYSRERLMSEAARANWLPPDLKPLS